MPIQLTSFESFESTVLMFLSIHFSENILIEQSQNLSEQH